MSPKNQTFPDISRCGVLFPPTLESVRSLRDQHSLIEFVAGAWPVIEAATPYVHGWHVDAICEHLEAVTSGEIRNLVINMPPRHMKSLLVSVFWPCWDWTLHPSRRWLFASYAQSLATRDSVKCRRLIRSPWYQRLYGRVFTLTGDQNQKMRFENDKTGYRIATSVGGLGTGEGGDRIIVDDPHNVLEAESQRVRSKALSWWDETMASRGNDPKSVARVIVMQRVHEDDLTGHVLEQGGYEHLCLPAEFEGQRSATRIGWTDPRTTIGELLCPNRFGDAELAELKLRLGARASAGQLQQRPAPTEGVIFKAEWFKNRCTTLPNFTRVATFWDTAIKAKEENDETACITLGVGDDGNAYLLRALHGRWETPSVASFLCSQATYFRDLFADTYKGNYIEDKVSGTTLIQYVRRSRPDLPLIPIKVELDKVARAHGITPICESGRVIFPDPAVFPASRKWTDDVINALLSFPTAKHDDLTDVFVYALKWFMTTPKHQKISRRGRSGGQI
jgi:predicted phage terminase large subunit-like protein